MSAPHLNDRSTPIRLLATRRSGKARDLIAPGPSADEQRQILEAATRVPDHGKLAPWRYVVIDDRDRLADTLQRLYRAQKPDSGRIELEALATAARQAPLLIAALSVPRPDSHIPVWEQQLSMGASIMALMLAAHALGYAGNWLTGPATTLADLPAEFGYPDARLAGFIHIGTASKPLDERPRPALADIVSRFGAV